ncbi:MAG: hypothetical protein AAF127_08150 [Pseudomonadota bacterium]
MAVTRACALALIFCASGLAAQERVVPSPPALELRELTLVHSNEPEAPSTITVEAAEVPPSATRILDPLAALRLFNNEGVTLQWIGWEKRGRAWIAIDEDGHWLLTAEQRDPKGARLDLEGFITEIGSDYFLYSGTIKILGAPDEERLCNTTKDWRFAITQNRSYYRLREFEWCDGLTDYIDIYFDR